MIDGSGDDRSVGFLVESLQPVKFHGCVRVKQNADAPFDQVAGKEVTLVATVPVLNAPIVMNTNLLSDEEIQILKDLLTSDEVANNPLLFGEKGSDVKTLFRAGQRMVLVDDEWYDPIRELSGLK